MGFLDRCPFTAARVNDASRTSSPNRLQSNTDRLPYNKNVVLDIPSSCLDYELLEGKHRNALMVNNNNNPQNHPGK